MEKKNLYKYREKLYKSFFIFTDYFNKIVIGFSGLSGIIFTLSSIFFIVLFCFYIGFYKIELNHLDITKTFRLTFLALFLSKTILEAINFKKRKLYIWIFDGALLLYGLSLLYFNFTSNHVVSSYSFLFIGKAPLVFLSIIIILTELNKLLRIINSFNIPPALLFVISFLLVIVIGSGLLMLPKAHTQQLSYLNALFTSTSAVCVTGLVVVDTATAFTPLGKIIILSLIQIGGLGIMTFTGFFSYIFTGSASFRERMVLKDLLSSENLGNLFKILTKILLITFLTELVGAFIIYLNLPENVGNKIFFSIFHSISAFCNAGFSTLSDGLFSNEIRTNNTIQLSMALLIILGGIGFPVLLSIYKYFKYLIVSFIRKIQGKRTLYFNISNINTSIVLWSTILLLVIGMVMYYFFEKDASLRDMSLPQRLVVTFFGSVSARTCGFNVIDISLWSYPTIFVMIFLMWVGASPGSTGGGIKTTTFAVGLRATYSFIRGKKSLEIRKREIGSGTIIRVLVVIILSISVILFGFMGLLIFEPTKNPVHLLFESFSAFGTVGLSIANTATLNEKSKIILIILMFIGRVGPLTLLTGILTSKSKRYHRYPIQDLIIN